MCIKLLQADSVARPTWNCHQRCILKTVFFHNVRRFIILLEIFQVFVWLWLVNFIIGLGQVTLSGAFGSYYWAFDKRKDIPLFPVTSSLGRCVRYDYIQHSILSTIE